MNNTRWGKSTIFREIEKICEKYPQKTAIIFLGEKFSYSTLRDLVERFSYGLSKLGVKLNDRVMLYIGNSPQFIISYFGIQEIGAIPVPVSPIFTPFELEYIIRDCQIDTIVCHDTNFRYVMEVSQHINLKRIVVTNIADLIPWWKWMIGRVIDKIPKGKIIKRSGIYLFKELIKVRPGHTSAVNINPEEQIASILYTGGTTGFPKGVPSSHAKMLSTLNDFRESTKNHILEGGSDIILVTIPLFHMMGQEAVFGWGLAKGISVVIMPFPQVDALIDTIQSYKVTILVGVPALYRMILGNERLNSYDLSSLKYCWSGGDLLPSELFTKWYERFHIPLLQDYGTTETGCVTLSPLTQFPENGSIGFPLPSKQVRVVDPNNLKDVPLNQIGELMVYSDYSTKSYWNKSEEISNSFIEIDGKIWHLTKDYIRMDENGQLFYIDRSADMIKYKGYRISPSEIETVLQGHHAVKEACVVGISNPDVGELIKAIVVLKGGTRGVSSSELIRWCREKLAPYKIPDYIEFRDMLPKSKLGKLLRQEIREEERRRWLKRSK